MDSFLSALVIVFCPPVGSLSSQVFDDTVDFGDTPGRGGGATAGLQLLFESPTQKRTSDKFLGLSYITLTVSNVVTLSNLKNYKFSWCVIEPIVFSTVVFHHSVIPVIWYLLRL